MFEQKAKEILQKHNCKFIKMVSECHVLWENQSGNTYCDDLAVLEHMTDDAWKFWEIN